MPDLAKQITFVELLESCQRIEVPLLQRDYAQGRDTAKEVRDGFLDSLYMALMRPADEASPPLNLDFVYGSMEMAENGERHFLPLDGQQRLTTLFLLHWYLAWRDGASPGFPAIACDGQRSRFSYAVRPSSTEFFDELAQFVPDGSPEEETSVGAMIENQSWFYLHWRLDPTVQSSLTMLDAIHLRFASSSGLFARLLDKEQPAITFQLLPLEHFGLSDDLYIKMNARGKPLTPFETFKARFEEHLKELYPTERREIGGTSVPVHDFFSRRMDTHWTDFFWSYRTAGSAVFDAAVMNLFWIVAWVSTDSERSPGNGSQMTRYRDGVGNYSDFHQLGLLTKTFADNLICLLEAWSAGGGQLKPQLPNASYFDEAAFFEMARTSPTMLEYSDLVMFAAFASYLRANEGNVDSAEFQEWMRVVFNLVQNSDIERSEELERSLSGLKKLLPHSRQILRHLANDDVESLGFNQQQLAEESTKAQLLLADAGWMSRIHAAESHGYFQGQIEFILDFSDVLAEANNEAIEDWTIATHQHLQDAFDVYLKKAWITFDGSGLCRLSADHLWQRALLATGDYLLPYGRNRSFLTNPAKYPDSWKRFLRGSGAKREIMKKLWDALDANEEIKPQLAAVIANARDLEPWRSAIVHQSKVISYCEQREIRQDSSSLEIYLLRKRQMNGAHAELFSFALHAELSSKADELSPLQVEPYESVVGAWEEPYFFVRLHHSTHPLRFKIKSKSGRFVVTTGRPSVERHEGLRKALEERIGFTEQAGVLVSSVSRMRMHEVLHQIIDLFR